MEIGSIKGENIAIKSYNIEQVIAAEEEATREINVALEQHFAVVEEIFRVEKRADEEEYHKIEQIIKGMTDSIRKNFEIIREIDDTDKKDDALKPGTDHQNKIVLVFMGFVGTVPPLQLFEDRRRVFCKKIARLDEISPVC
ncbi:hypothetical protein QYM36_014255 [Artemia franciscana]|uniref:Uncharacterized protein n=1 Tax=Artemia franciscana TaxID=6661 RepID=A0AA88HE20_ARTSF|nr:hypothetical protein QYM36_014255 [Artemia franciscana]